MLKILGISGKKGAGKDTLANCFEDYCKSILKKEVEIIPFAFALKETCCNLFCLNKENVYGSDEDKNKKVVYKWSDMPGFISKEMYFELKKNRISPEDLNLFTRDDCEMSTREFLQFFGTEVCRKIKNDIHIHSLFNKINLSKKDFVIIPDVRFENEIESIQQNGGVVIRLNREISQDDHFSENCLDSFSKFDLIINNTAITVEQELSLLNSFLSKKGWFK